MRTEFCAFHNYARSRDGFNIEDALSIAGFIDTEWGTLALGPTPSADQSI